MDPSWGRRGGASRLGRFVRLLPETRVPAGLPCTDGRIRLIYVPGGEAPAARPSISRRWRCQRAAPSRCAPGSEPAPPWSSTSTPCRPWTPANARGRWRSGPTTCWWARILDLEILDTRDGLGRLPGRSLPPARQEAGRSLARAWRAAGHPPGEDDLLHARRLLEPLGHNPLAILPPAAFEAHYSNQLHEAAMVA